MAPSRPEVDRAAPTRRTVVAAMLVATLLGLVVDRTIAGRDERHHQTAVAIARAIHDIVF